MLSTNVSVEQKINYSGWSSHQGEICIKRDDLIHPFISGNKWRKLKYHHMQFEASSCKGIVTFGGAYSNHLVATAAFCAERGIASVGVVRGEQPSKLNHMLLMCKVWGMQLKFISREEYRLKSESFLEREAPEFYTIAEGGEGEEGQKGCAEIISELRGEYDHILCASGTGTTVMGLIKGVRQKGLGMVCHSFPVLKGGQFIEEKMKHYFSESERFKVHPDFHLGGYAKTNPELMQFMGKFSSETGVLLDPIYTAKLFYGFTQLLNRGYFGKKEKIILLHTGGLLGLMSEKMLNAVQNSL